MPFIRLSDDYNDHPKFAALSDGAFRLWHQGLGFCRKYQTDGLIPVTSLRQLKAYSPKRMRELMTPWRDGAQALWQDVPGFGVVFHDYLEWNLSKEEETDERTATAARVRRFRARRKGWRNGVTDSVTDAVTTTVTNAFVPARIGTDQKERIKQTPEDQAAQFIEAYREQWKTKYGLESTLDVGPLQFARVVDRLKSIPLDRLLEGLAAFFATPERYVLLAKHPLPLYLRDPLVFLAPVVEPSSSGPADVEAVAKILGIDPKAASHA